MLQVHFKLDRMAEQVGHGPGSYIQVIGQADDANGSHGGFATQFISNGDENGDGDKNGDGDGDKSGKSIHLAGRWSSVCCSASR